MSVFLIGLLVGIFLGGLSVFFLFKKQNPANQSNKMTALSTEKNLLEKNLQNTHEENNQLKEKEKEFIQETTKLKADYESKNRELESQKKFFEENSQKLKLEFQTMAQKIFNETNKQYKDSSEKSLETILKPLKEDITGFKKSIESFEGKEETLESTIKDFKELNKEMRDTTRNLSQSLQGSTKTQGQFGEILLAKILEKAGLREGEEFSTQSSIKDGEGNSQRPDVVVNLPDNKHIVIDSKTSLTHYMDYETETDKTKKEEHKKKVMTSLLAHIQGLSTKDYSSSLNIKSPDFVLMFIPSEPVFSLAIQDSPNLFEKAWEKSIVIVSPITLYATLKTISSIWKIEKQNKNAEKIAIESGRLYDKFVGFLDDMDKLSKNLDGAKDSYHSAINKLRTGKGNLISKIEGIKKLGAKTNKDVPDQFIDTQ